eukprot:Hpha_TRINITY_DN24836_c0_g1::TRINITY_DN24836_c0_g1_i1::g.97249::m.97249
MARLWLLGVVLGLASVGPVPVHGCDEQTQIKLTLANEDFSMCWNKKWRKDEETTVCTCELLKVQEQSCPGDCKGYKVCKDYPAVSSRNSETCGTCRVHASVTIVIAVVTLVNAFFC